VAFLARAIVWFLVAAGLLAGGLAALGWAIISFQGPGYAKLGDMQRIAFQSLYSAILLQALLPQAASAFVGWLGLTALVPALDAGWKRLVPGLLVVAGLCFPIAARGFVIWQPSGARDVISTFALLTGSVGLALLLPRLLPMLGPGVFWPKIPSDS